MSDSSETEDRGAAASPTAEAVREAEAVLAYHQLRAKQVETDCLRRVAEGIPGRLDAVGRSLAQANPDVTRALGQSGVAELRAELSAAAASLAAQIEAAQADVEWVDKAHKHALHDSLFPYLYGRLDPITTIFRKHGYDPGGAVLPQNFYDREDSHAELSAALKAERRAEDEVDHARRADDQAVVRDLWPEQ